MPPARRAPNSPPRSPAQRRGGRGGGGRPGFGTRIGINGKFAVSVTLSRDEETRQTILKRWELPSGHALDPIVLVKEGTVDAFLSADHRSVLVNVREQADQDESSTFWRRLFNTDRQGTMRFFGAGRIQQRHRAGRPRACCRTQANGGYAREYRAATGAARAGHDEWQSSVGASAGTAARGTASGGYSVKQALGLLFSNVKRELPQAEIIQEPFKAKPTTKDLRALPTVLAFG